MWKKQNPKSNVNPYRQDSEILAEFQAMGAQDAELAEALLNLHVRQEPDNTLRQRILSIPDGDGRMAFPFQQEIKGEKPMSTYRPGNGRLVASRFALIGITLLILVVVLVTSIPATRTLALQAIAEIRQSLGIGMQGSADGHVTFTPGFPFNVKQPDYLPEGFRRTSVKQAPFTSESGAVEALVEEVIVSGSETSAPSSPSSSATVLQRVAAYDTVAPHVIFTYEATPDHYILLFERAAAPDETLPAGEARTVNGRPAALQSNGNVLILSWIEDGTWLTLESTLAEEQLLQTAESMVTTQTISEADQDAVQSTNDTSGEYPFCNPEEQATRDALLERAEVAGQQRWGAVEIRLSERNLPLELIPYSISVENVTPEDMFQRALTALQNPALTLQPIDYASPIGFVLSEEKRCRESVTRTPGHIDFVIDIWDEQVNISVGGTGIAGKDDAELRALAIDELEQKLQRILPNLDKRDQLISAVSAMSQNRTKN